MPEPDRLEAVSWPVRTARLSLRRMTPGDLEGTWRYRRRPEVARWMGAAPETAEAYRTMFEDPARLARTVLVERAGELVGDLMLRVNDPWVQEEVREAGRGVQAELGWCLDPARTGLGYATEAVQALLRVCFVDLGLRRVTAECFADNTASWRLMERVGLRREAHTRADALHRTEGWLDGFGYALLAAEWRSRQTAPSTATP